jgi:hypothetical protein
VRVRGVTFIARSASGYARAGARPVTAAIRAVGAVACILRGNVIGDGRYKTNLHQFAVIGAWAVLGARSFWFNSETTMASKISRTIIPAEPGWRAVTPAWSDGSLPAEIEPLLDERPVVAWCIERHEDVAEPNERVIPITTDLTLEPRSCRHLLLRDPAGVYRREDGTTRSRDEALTYFTGRARARSARNAARGLGQRDHKARRLLGGRR